ncbi:ankyrin repeat domain-containing protein [Persicimonas caeni]|nr:ankyrin repeat domain-containing protein [Persicimonas caeni]
MEFSRDRVVRQARLHHALYSLSMMYFGINAGDWQESAEDGRYVFDNGMGEHFCLAWNDKALVGLAASDESQYYEAYLPEEEREPLERFEDLPDELRELGEYAAEAVEHLASAGLWCRGDECGMSQPMNTNWADGLEQLAGFGLDAREAMFGEVLTMPWSHDTSLSPAHCEVVLSWLDALDEGKRVSVSDADNLVLLEVPNDISVVTVESAQAAAEHLALMGVDWDVPVDELERRLAAGEEDHRAQVIEDVGEEAYALVEAAREGDVARVRKLLENGADINTRTVEGQWEYVPEGDTPLIQALKAEHHDVANLLLAAGADCHLANRFGQTALTWAVEGGDVSIVRQLLKRGADVNVAAQDGTTPLHIATRDGSLVLVELLVEEGADTTAAMWNGKTPADLAEMLGLDEILQLLTAQQG